MKRNMARVAHPRNYGPSSWGEGIDPSATTLSSWATNSLGSNCRASWVSLKLEKNLPNTVNRIKKN
jgi:hypothetical protein